MLTEVTRCSDWCFRAATKPAGRCPHLGQLHINPTFIDSWSFSWRHPECRYSTCRRDGGLQRRAALMQQMCRPELERTFCSALVSGRRPGCHLKGRLKAAASLAVRFQLVSMAESQKHESGTFSAGTGESRRRPAAEPLTRNHLTAADN